VVAGFSQGGIMSASVALSAPQSVGGFGLLSGRILPELEPHIADRAQLAGLRALVSHGEHDATLPVHWAHRSDALLTGLGVPHELRLYPMDHGISASMQADFVAWLAA
jgi:phospholipase/carboxylesterase